MYIVHWTLVRL